MKKREREARQQLQVLGQVALKDLTMGLPMLGVLDLRGIRGTAEYMRALANLIESLIPDIDISAKNTAAQVDDIIERSKRS